MVNACPFSYMYHVWTREWPLRDFCLDTILDNPIGASVADL